MPKAGRVALRVMKGGQRRGFAAELGTPGRQGWQPPCGGLFLLATLAG